MSTYSRQKTEKARASHRWQSVTATMEICLHCCLLKRALLNDNGAAHYTSEYVRATPEGFIVTSLAGVCPMQEKPE